MSTKLLISTLQIVVELFTFGTGLPWIRNLGTTAKENESHKHRYKPDLKPTVRKFAEQRSIICAIGTTSLHHDRKL